MSGLSHTANGDKALQFKRFLRKLKGRVATKKQHTMQQLQWQLDLFSLTILFFNFPCHVKGEGEHLPGFTFARARKSVTNLNMMASLFFRRDVTFCL